MNRNFTETKQERRDKKLRKKRERMPKHGRSLARVYADAILKRLRRRKGEQAEDKQK